MRISHGIHSSSEFVSCSRLLFVFDILFEYLPPRSANFAYPELMHYKTLGQLNDPCPSFNGATRFHTLFDCCVVDLRCCGCPWMRCDCLRPRRRARSRNWRVMKNGSLAMILPSIVVSPEAPIAYSRIQAGANGWMRTLWFNRATMEK